MAILKKNLVKGKNLSNIGKDANNQIFSLGWVVIQKETKDNWMWFILLFMALVALFLKFDIKV